MLSFNPPTPALETTQSTLPGESSGWHTHTHNGGKLLTNRSKKQPILQAKVWYKWAQLLSALLAVQNRFFWLKNSKKLIVIILYRLIAHQHFKSCKRILSPMNYFTQKPIKNRTILALSRKRLGKLQNGLADNRSGLSLPARRRMIRISTRRRKLSKKSPIRLIPRHHAQNADRCDVKRVSKRRKAWVRVRWPKERKKWWLKSSPLPTNELPV